MDFLLAASLLSFVLAAVSLAVAAGDPRRRLPLGLAAGVLAGCGAGSIHMVFAGSVLLFDPTGRVTRAALFSGGKAIEMVRLPGGLFYGEPAGDRSVRVTCADRRVIEFGYFTPGMPSFERLEGQFGC